MNGTVEGTGLAFSHNLDQLHVHNYDTYKKACNKFRIRLKDGSLIPTIYISWS